MSGPSPSRLTLLAATTLLTPLAPAQKPAPTPPPIQTELLKPLDSNGLTVGGVFITKNRADRTVGTCHLPPNALIAGHIVDKSTPGKGSSFTVIFDQAQCDGKTTNVQLTLFAILAKPLYGSLGEAPDSTGLLANTQSQEHMSPLSNGTQRDNTLEFNEGLNNRPNMSSSLKNIKPGQVNGMDNVTLSIGTGAKGGSVLSTKKGNIRFEPQAQFLLIPTPPPATHTP
jgi:hypothetical protein